MTAERFELVVVDVHIEPDDEWLPVVEDRVQHAAQARQTIQEVRIRAEQRDWLQGWLRLNHQGEASTLFGIPILVADDGLTPRERSVKRAERDLGQTRQQQVAAFLEAERAAHEHVARQLREADEATRQLGDAAAGAAPKFDLHTGQFVYPTTP